ncbi:hypothetical protein SFRURICE_017868 [Spodoptera frugiperda]|nr:hypothetical protein SFRURICE_017868 [Spodoptera frugiperda]
MHAMDGFATTYRYIAYSSCASSSHRKIAQYHCSVRESNPLPLRGSQLPSHRTNRTVELETPGALQHWWKWMHAAKLYFLYGKMRALDGFPTIDTSYIRAAHLRRIATLR